MNELLLILLCIIFVASLFYFIMFIYPKIEYKRLPYRLDLIKKSITVEKLNNNIRKFNVDVSNLNSKEVKNYINVIRDMIKNNEI